MPRAGGKPVLQNPAPGRTLTGCSTFYAARRVALLAVVACFRRCRPARRPAGPVANAADILRAVREGQGSRHETLDGQLRNDADGKVFPFRLAADGPLVRYQFEGTPPTVVQVRYNEENSQLEESTAGPPKN